MKCCLSLQIRPLSASPGECHRKTETKARDRRRQREMERRRESNRKAKRKLGNREWKQREAVSEAQGSIDEVRRKEKEPQPQRLSKIRR